MNKVEGVIFDWAGTTVDYGCFAPVKVFVDIFSKRGITPTLEEARGPMGVLKIDHVRAMLSMERIAKLWKEKFGKNWTESDVNSLYSEFEEQLFKTLKNHAQPIPGIIETVKFLRERGLKIGSTTGYTREMMNIVEPLTKEKGYFPDYLSTPTEVLKGRPAPFMIFDNMIKLGLEKSECVIKVGDTISDIKEGLSAKCWTVGVVLGSSELGLSEEEVDALYTVELLEKIEVTRQKFLSNGAHFVINNRSELINVIDEINKRLTNGEFPY